MVPGEASASYADVTPTNKAKETTHTSIFIIGSRETLETYL